MTKTVGGGDCKVPSTRTAIKRKSCSTLKTFCYFGALLAVGAAAAASHAPAPPDLVEPHHDLDNEFIPLQHADHGDGPARAKEAVAKTYDGRSVLVLGGRAPIPTCLPVEEARGQHGERLRPDENPDGKNRSYLLNLINGSGIENGVWRAFLKGSPDAEQVIHDLWRDAVAAKRYARTVFVPLIHHLKKVASKGERAYMLAKVAADASNSSVVEAGLIHREKALQKTSSLKREDRPGLHKNSIQINLGVLKKIVDAGQNIVLVDDGVCSGSTLAAARDAILKEAQALDLGVDVNEIVVVNYRRNRTSLQERRATTASDLLPSVAKKLADASVIELQKDGTTKELAAHAGVVYAFEHDGYVYVGSHIVPEKAWPRLRKKLRTALESKNVAKMQAVANELGEVRAKKHQTNARAGTHNQRISKWLSTPEMRKNFDIKKIFATQAVIVSRKYETRHEFYVNGLLPLEQAALDQLHRENKNKDSDVNALNVEWVASGSAMHLQEKRPDPDDPNGPDKRPCDFIEAMEKAKVTNARPEIKAKRQKSQKAANPKRKKTKKTSATAAAENGKLYQIPWGDWEERLLREAIAAHGTNAWDSVAIAIDSRAAVQCKSQYEELVRKKRWDSVTRETRLDRYPAPLKGLRQDTIAKFIAGEITTVGQLADIGPRGPWHCDKIAFREYARKLMKVDHATEAVNAATKWKGRAIAALNKNYNKN